MSITNLTCPSCNTTNRIPTERLADSPRCGRCKEQLFQGEAVELTSANVSKVIGNTSIPVLVDCWAPWCGPCQGFAPIFTRAAQEMEPRVRFAKLNTEAEEQLAGLWSIRSIPTLILFRDGREEDRKAGALPLYEIMQWLEGKGI